MTLNDDLDEGKVMQQPEQSGNRPGWMDRAERGIAGLTLTRDQFSALADVLGVWFQLKALHEPRLTDEQRAYLRQLDPDAWHSALLWRMLGEGKPPEPARPDTDHAYPVYRS